MSRIINVQVFLDRSISLRFSSFGNGKCHMQDRCRLRSASAGPSPLPPTLPTANTTSPLYLLWPVRSAILFMRNKTPAIIGHYSEVDQHSLPGTARRWWGGGGSNRPSSFFALLHLQEGLVYGIGVTVAVKVNNSPQSV